MRIITTVPPPLSTTTTKEWSPLTPVRSAANTAKSKASAMNASTCTFCGGPKCKHCGPVPINHHYALANLNSAWITPNILAMARPAKQIMDSTSLVADMSRFGIQCIINLQLPFEHPSCGFGTLPSTGFSYDPEDWIRANFFYYNVAWEDMNTPSVNQMLNIVKIMTNEIASNRKVAVHCHAGLGRTGLAIACYLVYSIPQISGTEAIGLVREKRRHALQTSQQVEFVLFFADHVTALIHAVTVRPANFGKFDLISVMAAHQSLFHGHNAHLQVHMLMSMCLNQIKIHAQTLVNTNELSHIFNRVILDGSITMDEASARDSIFVSFSNTLQQQPTTISCEIKSSSLPVLVSVISTWCIGYLKDPPLQLAVDQTIPSDFNTRSNWAPRSLTLAMFNILDRDDIRALTNDAVHISQSLLYVLTRQRFSEADTLNFLRFQLGPQLPE